jgi:hypothetical protein
VGVWTKRIENAMKHITNTYQFSNTRISGLLEQDLWGGSLQANTLVYDGNLVSE